MVTKSFSEWIGEVDPEGHEEVHALYQSVRCISDEGLFKTVQAKGSRDSWIVSAVHNDESSLLLASEKARASFLIDLEKCYCGDLDMEGWYSYRRAMSKDD